MNREAFFSFKTPLISGIALLMAVSALSFYALFCPSHSAEKNYRELVCKANPTNSNVPANPFQAKQHGKKVQKEIAFAKEGKQLHWLLNSEEAEIIVHHERQSTKLVEQLKKASCFMQEDLFYLQPDKELEPMQHVQHLMAAEANYSYNSGQFTAKQAKLFRYTLPGHRLPDTFEGIQPEMTGSAQKVDFALSDKKLSLQGESNLEHELGSIFADEVEIYPLSEEKKFQLGLVEMHKNVKFRLKERGELICERAELDFPKQIGHFYNGPSCEFVVYSEKMPRKTDSQLLSPLTIKSRHMTTQFAKEGNKSQLSRIVAEDQAELNYGTDFTAVAQALMWDRIANVITMSEQAIVCQKGLGKVTTEEEIKFYQCEFQGKNRLSHMETEGKTILTWQTKGEATDHVITCFGRLLIDHINLTASMDSPLDSKGQISDGQQIFYKDIMGEIYADNALIRYELSGKQIVPKKIILLGHVRLLDHSTTEYGTESPLSKYVLADTLEYDPDTKEAFFTADKGQRVLLYSKANNLQVSAQALKIKRDQVTRKDSIKGVGNVRFNFIEHEFEQLKKRFSLNQPPKKNNQRDL
jgi:hypothetical protein